MEISKSSLKSKFYCKYFGVYSSNQTVNGCDFMWAFIFASLSLPLSWVTLPFDFWSSRGKVGENLFQRSFIGLVVQFMLLFIVYCFYTQPMVSLKLTGAILVLFACFFLLAYCMHKYEKIKNRTKYNNTPKEPWIIVSAYKSFKEKHCPKITWID